MVRWPVGEAAIGTLGQQQQQLDQLLAPGACLPERCRTA
jgi:hypothetical protein